MLCFLLLFSTTLFNLVVYSQKAGNEGTHVAKLYLHAECCCSLQCNNVSVYVSLSACGLEDKNVQKQFHFSSMCVMGYKIMSRIV
jgi:hypothetical protein